MPPSRKLGLCSFDESSRPSKKALSLCRSTFFMLSNCQTVLQPLVIQYLNPTFNAIVTTLTATVVDITMDDFYAHLLAFEMRFKSQNAILQSPPVANLAHNRQSGSRNSS
ncbi:hypothetical protein FRX31_019288 [Thalictrum thalictroides]|uniref:Uncharacterized protein n=1 Tax=Thalictrum thalictroides TaxID=46969 RepID=A0A7J6W157_THATH|nr:hypothetical protein FRX31_019288 [Thalictrum thalictroides]